MLLALTLCIGVLLFDACALLQCRPKQLITATSRGHRLLSTVTTSDHDDDEPNEKNVVGGWNSNTFKRVESMKSKKLSAVGEPQIFSKQALFGNGYNAVTVSAVDEEFSAAAIGQKTLPKGIERLQPSELVKKTPINNNGDHETDEDEYEIVDKFRFNIDADTLRNAILQKQSLIAHQELSSTVGSDLVPLAKQEVSFDAAFLEKLTSSGTLDESGDSTVLRVQLDYDEFESMVRTTPLAEEQEEGEGNKTTPADDGDDKAALFSSNPVFVDRQMRRDRKDSLQYSSIRMDEAERFLAQSSPSSSSFHSMAEDGRKDRGDRKQAHDPSDQTKMDKSFIPIPARLSPQYNNDNSTFLRESWPQSTTSRKAGILSILLRLTAKFMMAATMTAAQQPQGGGGLYWTDVTPAVLADSVYGTAFVGFSLAGVILMLDRLCQWLVRSVIYSFNLVLDRLSWITLHQKLALKRGSKPIIFMSVILVRLLWIWRDRHVRHNRFNGIGHQVHDKF